MQNLNQYKQAKKIILSPDSYGIVFPEKEANAIIELLEATQDPAASLTVLYNLLKPRIYRIFPLSKLLNDCDAKLRDIYRKMPVPLHLIAENIPITGDKPDEKRFEQLRGILCSDDSYSYIFHYDGLDYFNCVEKSSEKISQRIKIIEAAVKMKYPAYPIRNLTDEARDKIMKICRNE